MNQYPNYFLVNTRLNLTFKICTSIKSQPTHFSNQLYKSIVKWNAHSTVDSNLKSDFRQAYKVTYQLKQMQSNCLKQSMMFWRGFASTNQKLDFVVPLSYQDLL